MNFSGTHRFLRPIDQVTAAFLDPDAHVGRYALMGHRDLEVLQVDVGDGTLALQLVRTVDGEVPAVASKVLASTNITSTNTVTTTDRWERDADGGVSGTSVIEAGTVPGTATLTATVHPDGSDACTYTVALDLALRIPLIGDRFVKLLRPHVMEIIEAEFAAWDGWLERPDAS